MKGEGPRHERETIVNFNEEEDTAWLWTASVIVYSRLLKRLGREYLTEDSERHAEFKLPVSFVQLPRPKRRVTEAQREAGRHRRRALLGQERQDNPGAEQSNEFDEGVSA